MKRIEGIVLQVEKGRITILSSDGEFLRLPHRGESIQVGEQFSSKAAADSPRSSWSKIIVAAACLAAAFFLLITPGSLDQLTVFMPGRAPGYLVIDINPSLELVFDQNLVVTDCRSFDPAAAELTEGWPENSPLPQAIEWLLERSLALGYLDAASDDNIVLVTVIEPARVRLDPEMVADFIDLPLAERNVSAQIAVSRADRQLREQAGAAGLSLNRFILVEEARRQGGREIPEESNLREALSALPDGLPEAVFRTAGKAPIKIPAPQGADPPAGPPVDPAGTVERSTETRAPAESAPGPPVNIPGPPAEKPGPPGNLPGPPGR